MDGPLKGKWVYADLEYKYRLHIEKLRFTFPDADIRFTGSPKSFGVIIRYDPNTSTTLLLERRIDATPPHLIRYRRIIRWWGWRPHICKQRTTPCNWITKTTSLQQIADIIDRTRDERKG